MSSFLLLGSLSLYYIHIAVYDKVREKHSRLEGRVIKNIPQEYEKISGWASGQRAALLVDDKSYKHYVKTSLLNEIQFDWREEEREEKKKKKKSA